ncbi:hypothetical protein KUV26_08605 [Leisingera daeponensis]|uniref:Uncharacterized protein n=1 Tax=Leisingera daeponensis TaxID=405746 RepID=A0ABS7NEA1_9RHOB|nr:hypothetical protein [Leisingera daeponensis]MBY6139490.1 hypothetical protein [Leisingera daeponensis]
MDAKAYNHCCALLRQGELEKLSEILQPLVETGDQDALYLNLMFSLEESGADFDKRRTEGLKALARLKHKRAVFDLAWLYRHGDDGVEQDELKFLQLLTASAFMGDESASKLLKAYLAAELDWDCFPKEA